MPLLILPTSSHVSNKGTPSAAPATGAEQAPAGEMTNKIGDCLPISLKLIVRKAHETAEAAHAEEVASLYHVKVLWVTVGHGG